MSNRSIVVDHLRKQFENRTDVGVAYIYCSYKEKDAQTPVNLIASLLVQLAIDKEHRSSEDVNNLYQKHRQRNTRPSLEEVSDVLQSAVGRFSKVFIIVDALDECPEDGRIRSDLAAKLSSLPSSVNVLVTSRPGIEFPKAKQLEVKANIKDLQAYVHKRITRGISQVAQLSEEVRGDKNLSMRIVSTVAEKAEGMYVFSCRRMNINSDLR
jgi:hypothetical protein